MNQPQKIPCPFGKNAVGDSFLPDNTDAAAGRAGWNNGFPEVTAKPISAGGIPPHYSDFQMVLNNITQEICYLQEGGRYAWAAPAPNSGYNLGAVVVHGSKVWQSLSDNNSATPGTDATKWGVAGTVDGKTITVNGAGVMSVAASGADGLAQSLADGTTISAVKNASSAYTGKLAVNLANIAGTNLSASGSKLHVNAAGVAGALADGATISRIASGSNANKLAVVKVPNALTITANGNAYTYNGASAVNLTITQPDAFPAGTIMLFHGTVPTGWAMVTNSKYGNAALRLVTNSSANAGKVYWSGSGGANGFTNVFNAAVATNQVKATGTVKGHRLTVAEMPAHNHTMKGADVAAGKGTDCIDCGWRADYGSIPNFPTRNAGGNKEHSHDFAGNLHNHTVNVNVKYIDVYFAKKN